ncbi:hypothetical protein ACRAWF_30345 [Streptomyces sp. L7]
MVKGPDAQRFFSDHFVNNFGNLKVGGSRHGIMCDQQGRIMMDGTVLRVAEDEFIAIWLSPYIQYLFERGGYDAVGEDLTGREFLFQIAGPRSLEILEQATKSDLHDIAFTRHRPADIGGAEVRVYRLGMAGGPRLRGARPGR